MRRDKRAGESLALSMSDLNLDMSHNWINGQNKVLTSPNSKV